MRAFHLAVLRGMPRINEVMHDAALTAQAIKRVDSLHRHIAPFVCANVPIGESRVIISLHAGNCMRKSSEHIPEKYDGILR